MDTSSGNRGDLTRAGPPQFESSTQRSRSSTVPTPAAPGWGADSAFCYHWVSWVRARPPLRRSPALACPAPRPVPVCPLAADARPPARPPRRTAGLVVPPLRPHHGGARAACRVLGSRRGPPGCPRYSRCNCLPAPRALRRHPSPASLSAAVRPCPTPRTQLFAAVPLPRPGGPEQRWGPKPGPGRGPGLRRAVQAPAERAEVICAQRLGARESRRRRGARSLGTRCGTSAGKSGESLGRVSKSSGCHICLPWGQILGTTGSVCQSASSGYLCFCSVSHCLLADLVCERKS